MLESNMYKIGLNIIVGFLVVLSSCQPFYRYKLVDAKESAIALDLSSSDYVVPPDEIFNFPHLEDISLFNNSNLDIGGTVDKLILVENLSALNLGSIPEMDLKLMAIKLSKLKNLKHLYLSGDSITVLPPEIAMLTSLESIVLDNNPNIDISDVMEKLSKLRFLKFISMNNCGINEVPKTITNIKTLEVLSFYGNNLDSLPDMSLLPKINSIDIGGNKFGFIPESITKINSRFNLYLQSNKITTVPDNLAYLKFGTFNISNNPLTQEARAKVDRIINARYKFY